MTRLWQDTAGTIPAWQPGQTVGLIRRAVGTVDAVQATAGARPTLVRWPKGGRRNLAVNTEFGTGNLTGGIGGGSIAPAAMSGFAGAYRLELGGVTAYVYKLIDGMTGLPVTVSLVVELSTGAEPIVGNFPGYDFYVNVGGGTVTLTKTHLGGPRWLITASTLAVGATNFFGVVKAISFSAASVTFSGIQVEAGILRTPYQRVTTDADITEAGIPDVWHLSNDGNDSLPVSLPAGTYGRAWVDHLGAVTVDTVVDPANVLMGSRQVDAVLRPGAFTAAEEARVRDYWARYAG